MRQRSIGYIGAMALAMAPMAIAQEQTPTPETPPAQIVVQENRTIEGEVVEVSAEMLTIRTSDGRMMTFSVDRDLTSGAAPITVGSRVRVEYRGETELEVVNVSGIPLSHQEADDDNGHTEAARVETGRQIDPEAAPAAAEQEELPATASPLPLLLLTGLALLGSGVGLATRRG